LKRASLRRLVRHGPLAPVTPKWHIEIHRHRRPGPLSVDQSKSTHWPPCSLRWLLHTGEHSGVAGNHQKLGGQPRPAVSGCVNDHSPLRKPGEILGWQRLIRQAEPVICCYVGAKCQTHSREFPVAFRYGASITQKAQPCKDYSFQP